MNRKKLLQSKSRGSAMALMMVALVVLLVTGVGLLSLGLHGRILALRMASEIAARCAADAGLTKAVFEMNQKLKVKPWADSNLPLVTDEALPNCDAIFSYIVTGDSSNGFTIESVGNYGRAGKKVSSTLRLQGLFEYGILAQETIILKANTLVDGYNSLDANDTDVAVQIATVSTDEGSITLNSGTTVDGDVLTGIDYDFPPVTPPLLPDMGTGIYVKGTTVTIGSSDTGKYTDVTLLQGTAATILEVSGGDVVLHVTGGINVGQGCEIRIKPGSTLTVYLEGNFVAGNSSGVNNETGSPPDFVLYGTADEYQLFDLKAGSDFYGMIYAPNADIIVRAGGNIYGSFIGSSFELKSGGNFYYDGALSDASVTDVGVVFVVDRWYEE